MIFTVMCGLLFGSDGYYVALAWSSCALMFFIVSIHPLYINLYKSIFISIWNEEMFFLNRKPIRFTHFCSIRFRKFDYCNYYKLNINVNFWTNPVYEQIVWFEQIVFCIKIFHIPSGKNCNFYYSTPHAYNSKLELWIFSTHSSIVFLQCSIFLVQKRCWLPM